ncbi:MAG: hypothetical protein ACO2OO_02815 [Candidatus Aenigmatarchaeota archaeon]|jgi:hypothetical protein
MKGKVLLFIFLLAILALLIYFRPIQLPNLSSITGFFSKIISSQKPTYFQLYVDSIKEGQTFQLLNTTFSVNGICTTPISIGKVSIQTTSMPCKIDLYSPNGVMKVYGKNIYVEATSPLIKINGFEYITNEKISFQISVSSLFSSVFSQNIIIKDFKGRFEKLSDSGISMIVNFPPCYSIEILDFSGSFLMSNQTILLGNGRVSYWCENVKNKV